MKNWSRRTWITTVSVIVLLAVVTVVGIVVFATGTGSAVTGLDVTGAPAGTTFAVHEASGAPTVDATGIEALGSAYEIVPHGAITGALVRATLDRSKLPAGEPSCARPTTAINLGIEVFNTEIGEWIPLVTTCSGDTLTAPAPHFSLYRVVMAIPGAYTINATIRDISISAHTIAQKTQSVFDFTVESIDAAVNQVIQNATGVIRPGALVCTPTGARVSTVVGPDPVTGCVVAAAGGLDEFRLQNGLNVPLAVDLPEGSEDYLEPIEEPTNFEVSESLAKIGAEERGELFVPALDVARMTITDDAPNPIRMTASIDDTTLGLDIMLAALAPLGKKIWPNAKAVPDIFGEVGRELTAVARADGRKALTPSRVASIVKQVTTRHVGWGTFTSAITDSLEFSGCATSPTNTAENIAKADLRCAATIFGKVGGEVGDLLVSAASDFKLARTVGQDLAINAYSSFTGTDISRTDITIGLPPLLPDPVTGITPTVPATPACPHACGQAFGDPHLVTFDGVHYDFQQVGEFVAVKSTTDDLQIQVRQAPFQGSASIACNRAIAFRVAGHRVGIYLTTTGESILLDGKPVTASATPITLPGGGTLTDPPNAPAQTVTWPDGTTATVDNNYHAFLGLNVSLAAGRAGHVVGLLGNANASPADDLVTATGTALPDPAPASQLYGAFSQNWRVTQSASLFDYAPGQTSATFTDPHFPYAQTSLDTLPAANRDAATRVCKAAGIASGPTLDACILDVAVTGDASLATVAAVAGLSRATVVASSSVGEPWTDPQKRSGTAVLIYGNLGCSAVDTFQACTGGLWPTLPSAPWIWAHQTVIDGQPIVTFTATVQITAAQAAQPMRLTAAADNAFVATVNGVTVSTGAFSTPLSSVVVHLRAGTNTLAFTVSNTSGLDPANNPAGLAWELTVAQ